jgi:protein involved in polysaccharide export with SLBB domain
VKHARSVSVLAAWLVLAAHTVAHAQGGAVDLMGSAGGGRNVVAPTGGPLIAPMSRPVDPAEYIVGPGDLLQLNLSGGVTRSWDTMILPEGTLYVPSIGAIPLTGITLAEARQAVLKRLSSEYRGVSVDLRLLRPRTFLVNLIGETTRPGALEISAASRASEILTEGLFGPTASRRNVEIQRRTPQGEQRVRMDLTRFRLTGYLKNDPLLREGDVLFFPKVATQASIDGAVARSGTYDLTATDSLSTFFEMAGGAVPSATDRAVLVRFTGATSRDSLSFNVADVVAGRFNTPMRDGDHVFVYFMPRYHFLEQAGIFGEVQRPGLYPLLPGLTRLSDLVRTAGGFLPDADLASVRVFRESGSATEPDPELERLNQLGRRDMSESEYQALRARATSRRQDFRVDWNRLKQGSDLDIVLRTGDVVRIDKVVAVVRVEGEVRLPGLVQHVPGRTLSDYINLAGGYGDRAVRSKVVVKRAVTGQTILARDAGALEPGDLVWVPEKGDPQTWQNLQGVLLVAAQVATIILAIRAF